MIMNKNTNGFLPNKQNKYSIRKYTVGTASLLIGATLVFGAHAEDAKAAEEATVDSHQTPDAQPEASEAPVTADKATTPVETNEAPAPVTAEKVEAPVAEGETTEAETPEAVAPKTEEKSAETAEVTPAVEEKAETTPATDQKEADKAPTTEEKASEPVVEKAATEPAVAPEKAATSSENAPTTAAPKMDQPEVGTLDGVPTTVDNFNQLASDEEKAEALANFYAKGTGLSTEAAAEKVKSMNIDFSTADAQKVLADMLVAFANEQDKNKVAATPVSLRSARPMMRMAVAAEQPTGTLITKDNGITNISTTITDNDKDKDNDGIIYPHNYGYIDIQTSFDVADSVKSGDTFEIKYNNNMQISDFFENRVTPPAIKNAGGEVIATGTYDVNTRTMKYTFTDYVDKHNNVKVALDLVAYVERDVVKNAGKYNFEVEVAGAKTTKELDVKYSVPFENKQLNLYSFYNEYDNVTGQYSQTTYVNTKQQRLINPKIEIKGYGGEKDKTPESSSAVISKTDTLKIYEVPSNVTLPDSLKPDFTQLTLLSEGKDYTLVYGTDMVTVTLTDKDSTKRYVVYTEGQQDMNSNQPLVQSVTLHGETSDAKGEYFSHLYSENFIETTNSSAAGQGEQTYKLGNRVWEDMNDNDVQDIDDKGIANVTVTLKEAGTNKVLQTTTTDKDGYYLFEGLKNGNYIVEFTDPATNGEGKQYIPVKEHVGNKEDDSDSRVVNVTIQDKDDLSIDRGFEVAPEPKPATYELGDYVWIDQNNDGMQNSDEVAVKGVKVTLTKSDGSTMTTTTDEKGKYLFTGLENGEYTVKFSELPEGYMPTKTQAGGDTKLDSNGLESKVTINNANDYSVDLGIVKPEPQPEPKPATYELGDYVWIDQNNDGIQNQGEAAVKGVKVTLTKPDGSTMTTTTDEKGKYLFTGLENGEYTVTFSELPEGYVPTKTQAGGNTELDSNGLESKVTINNANNYSTDLGIVKPEPQPEPQPATYELGDYVWFDYNKDGIQNKGEAAVEGVTVTLTKPDGSTMTTKTDKDGKYLFTGLENGEYTVTFSELPEGYEPTKTQVGDDKLDSNGLESKVTIDNANNYSVDLGIVKPEVVPPMEDAKFNLGDKVWEDLNKDGIQNSNEPGISGVTVTLTKEDGTTVTAKTDENGNYKFTELPNGKYTVTFETPDGYEPTKANVGDDALDSDGKTVEVVIDNKDDMTIDSGFHKPEEVEPPKVEATFNLGDKVWEDLNKDGIQNSNEPGIGGVTVTLTKEDGTTVTAKTDENGNYKFTELPNGKYTVTFETPEGYEPTKEKVGDYALDSDGKSVVVVIDNKDDMTIDSGFHKPEEVEPPKVEATFNLGDKVWEDLNKDGIQNSNEPGIGGVTVTLTKEDGTTVTAKTDENGNYKFTELPNGKYTVTFETPEGYEPTKEKVGDYALDSDGKSVVVVIDNKDDMTIDSGFHKPEEVEPPKVEATFNLGDKVWEDLNKDGIQNSNEPGIGGVTVTLTKEDGTTVTTTTDENGNYKFTELPNGEYTVTFETPKGYEATKTNVGDDALDSDGQTVKVIINNKDDMTIDSGFHKPTPEEPMKPTPEKPEQPNNPTPEKPEQPNNPTPEKPEQPNNPTPEVPEQPGQPENPTPEKPEQPNNPTPEVPEQPGQPNNPTPEKPEQPSNPTPEMPEQPGNPSPSMPNQPMNMGTHGEMSHDKAPKHEAKSLPETGETSTNQAPLFGGLLAALGALFVVGRRKKQKDQ
ncbi:carboxypeptidase regulatory-like domain-containing protein [Staphylococcus pseudintermedius]|uniref:SdrD B-like domain-containing protein n=1 Tax=Staphylococcus pseudintermedius TaxID=283734 RepID=UPI0018EF3998|nr:SdrD B-like domain-containing protein [Staphylococcus pseudintermedius]QQJ53415.1 carboxypeptidase regulatory-like domain-containing protein [Staphylococcus pseudintermedius]